MQQQSSHHNDHLQNVNTQNKAPSILEYKQSDNLNFQLIHDIVIFTIALSLSSPTIF